MRCFLCFHVKRFAREILEKKKTNNPGASDTTWCKLTGKPFRIFFCVKPLVTFNPDCGDLEANTDQVCERPPAAGLPGTFWLTLIDFNYCASSPTAK